MSTSSETQKVPYTGNGVTTAFAFNYPFHAQGDLKVILRTIATGVETPKTLTTHYTIAGTLTNGVYADGATLTMLVAPSALEELWIYRDPDATQTSSWTENGGDPAKVKEQAFDKLTFLAQRLFEMVSRMIRFTETSDLSGITMTVEPPTALQSIRLNEGETAFEWFDPDSASAVTVTAPSYGIATETVLQDVLDYLNPKVRGSRASPISITSAGLTALSCAMQTWFITGSPGAIDLTSVDPNISAGTRVGQEIELVYCGSNSLTIFGNNTNKMITNGPRVMVDGSIWGGKWNGTAWEERYYNNL